MASYNPGTYEGTGRGYGGKLIVSVTVSENRIESVKVTQHKEYRGIAWGLNTTPMERFPKLIVEYQTLNIPEKRLWAEERSLETTEVDPTNPFTEFAWQYWNLATIAEFEVGDFALARHYYNLLLEKYPTDIRVYGCKQALARMDALEAKIRAEEGI